MTGAPEAHHQQQGYGLRRAALSPIETLAQSISTISPTATPVATIPLVYALAGNGTWLAYVLATSAIFLVALCVSRFARYSASPGSLYSYASTILPPFISAIIAWSLLLAYVATGSSVIGGFYHYGNLLILDAGSHVVSAVILAVVVTGISAAPMRAVADVAGVGIFGLLIDLGALMSPFACTLACITAAACVLLLMAHGGLTRGSLRVTH